MKLANRWLGWLAAASLGFGSLLPQARAYNTATVNGIKWTYTVSNGKATVGGGTGSSTAVPTSTSGAIVIPSTLGGYPVTGIGSRAFYACRSMWSVTIPASVTSIGENAFYECSSLKSVTIPDNVTNIGDGAFFECTGLKSVTLPGRLKNIGGGVFADCFHLKSVAIPSSVTNIGDQAFCLCIELENMTIPDNVKSVGRQAFNGCDRLASVTIGNSVKSIGDYAFSGCYSLTSLTIPSSATKLGSGTLSGCSGLRTLRVPASWAGTSKLSVASVPAGCEVVYVGAQLVLGSSSRTFTADAASSKELGVTADVSWTAKSSASWLTLKTASGSGNGTIVYNVAANTGTSSRTATITVSGGGISRTFTVMQSGKSGGGGTTAALTLGASLRSFTANAANSKELSLTANVAWTAKSSASWLTLKTAKGNGNGKVVYNVAANTGTASRTATIAVAGGGISRTFTVTQSGKSGGGGTTATLTLKSSSRSFSADAASGKEMSVTANVAWTAKSSASWLTLKTAKGSGNGKVVYNVAANTGTASRTATITVAGGGLTRTFTVIQSGKAKSAKSKSAEAKVLVTTSDGSDGATVVDGDESTGWSPSGAAGSWVALTFAEERDVGAVKVVGECLPEGMRALVSEDGDTWSEEGGEAVNYLWLLLPGEGEMPTVQEIVTEP